MFVKIERGRLAPRTTTGWRHNPKYRSYRTNTFNVYCTSSLTVSFINITSSITAQRLGCIDILWPPPPQSSNKSAHLHSNPKEQKEKKVGHVCRFNEAKKRCMTSLCFLLQQCSSGDRFCSLLTYRHRKAVLLRPFHMIFFFNCETWRILWILNIGMKTRGMSPMHSMSSQSCLIVFRM